jgi:hypothetical protein
VKCGCYLIMGLRFYPLREGLDAACPGFSQASPSIALMKRWAGEHPFQVAAMAVVLGWCAVVAVDMIRGRPLEDALFNASFGWPPSP